MKHEHPLSWYAIGRLVTTALIILFVWKTYSILILILVSTMLATALYPLVRKLDTWMPMVIATLLVVISMLIPFVLIGALVIPSLLNEFPDLLQTLDTIINTSPVIPPSVRTVDFTQYAQNVGNYILQSTSVVTGIVTSILTLLFLTFYLIFDQKQLMKLILSPFPRDQKKKLRLLLSDLAQVNGQYIRGNLLISLICGTIIFVGLSILGIPFALPLALFAAIMDLLPLIGSTIGMIPAIIIALAISPWAALSVAALYLIYQQVENAFLAPAIFNKALNLSPALGFLAVLIGGALFGIVGAFMALPIAASLPAIIKHIEEETDVL